MPAVLSATFETRRDAEMAVEHLVQEYGLDRAAIEIAAASATNSAGTRPAGGDLEDGHARAGEAGGPALTGAILVSVDDVDKEMADRVRIALATSGGTPQGA